MTISPPSLSLWGIYHGLLAAGPSSGASSALLERAAQGLEARIGFEEASAFLRSAVQSDDQGLQRRAWTFLGRRDLSAALMPLAEDLARAAGVDPEALATEGLTRPERLSPAPWWFESKFPLREGRGMVRLEDGALAVGEENALEWLCRVRERAEAGEAPEGFNARPHLIWIPKNPLQAVALNVLGGVFREDGQTFEEINGPGHLRVRALFPFPPPATGDYFLMDRRILKLKPAAELCREGKMPWKMLYHRLESMTKTITGVREIRDGRPTGKKRVMVRNPGLPLSLDDRLVPYPRSSRPLASLRAFSTFQHQFWEEMPEALAERLGADLFSLVPDRAVIHQYQFFHPQFHIPPGYGRSLYVKPGVRFFFIDAGRTWVGQATEDGRVADRSDEFSSDLLEYLSGLTGFAAPRRPSDPAAPQPMPDQKAEKMAVPSEAAEAPPSEIERDPTVPVSAERLEALKVESQRPDHSGLAYDDTSPGIPTLSENDRSTKKARGIKELLGHIFRRRP